MSEVEVPVSVDLAAVPFPLPVPLPLPFPLPVPARFAEIVTWTSPWGSVMTPGTGRAGSQRRLTAGRQLPVR